MEESVFEDWLEDGRVNGIGYKYLCIIWDSMDEEYHPVYVEDREDIRRYDPYGEAFGRESLIAAYDLYSESKIHLSV